MRFTNSITHGSVTVLRKDPPKKWYPSVISLHSEEVEQALLDCLWKEINSIERATFECFVSEKKQKQVCFLKEIATRLEQP